MSTPIRNVPLPGMVLGTPDGEADDEVVEDDDGGIDTVVPG
ncbi:hypothetical protein [Mycobacterium riyadhense]|nr:hypothetical protein [Mycobacterium riyadhense]